LFRASTELSEPEMPRLLLPSRLSGVFGVLLALSLCGCNNFGDVTASIAGSSSAPLPTDPDSLRAYADHWAQVYAGKPGEKYASINYARALRALTRYKEAAAVMQAAAVQAPKDLEVLGEYGKALADNGDLAQAKDVLSRSYPPDRPSWMLLSVQGSVADRLDDHEQAQQFYKAALKIAPDEPGVLSNLGLSFALSKQLGAAEDTLRQAAAQPKADSRVRQNLALILALEGKFGEAEDVSRRDMPPDEAAKNVQAIRSMIAQNDSWRALQSGAKRTSTKSASHAAPDPAATPS
jgi:Flp pilus assembly protein TadD